MLSYSHPYVADTPETAALFQLTLEQLGYHFEMRTQLLDFGVMMDVTFVCPEGTPEDADARFADILRQVQLVLENKTDENLTSRYNSIYNHYAFGLM